MFLAIGVRRASLGRGLARDGGRERDHVPGVERRPGVGRLCRAHRPAGRSARGQLPGLVAVGDRRRRHQPGADAGEHDRRPDRLERRRRCSPARRAAAARARCSAARPTRSGTVERDRRAVPDVSMLADIVPGYAIFCTATSDCVNAASPNPWQTVGGTSAATPLLAGGLALVDQDLRAQRPARPRPREPAALPARPLADRRTRLCSPTCLRSATTSARTSPAATARSAAARPAPGYDDASGWGSVNLASLAARRGQPDAAHGSGCRCRATSTRARTGAVLARVSCSGACRVSAYALVRVGGARPFKIRSQIAAIGGRGGVTFADAFRPQGQLRSVRSGLRHAPRGRTDRVRAPVRQRQSHRQAHPEQGDPHRTPQAGRQARCSEARARGLRALPARELPWECRREVVS